MGNSTSKKCQEINVVLDEPKRLELDFIESNVTHGGYQIYKFAVPKKKK